MTTISKVKEFRPWLLLAPWMNSMLNDWVAVRALDDFDYNI